MSGDLVNLRRARKRKARDDAETAAAANRAAFGVSRAERATGAALRGLAGRRLDGHRRDGAEPDATPPGDA